MIHTKRVIFMILPLLFVPLVYGLSSTPDACAVPRDPNWGKSGGCTLSDEVPIMTCCWEEPDILNPGETIHWCQACNTHDGDCEPPYRSSSTGPLVLPDEGVVDEGLTPTPTPSPTSPFGPTGGVFDPPTVSPPTPKPSPPPLFGRNIPQGGGFEIPQDSETPPMFGQATPEGPTLAEEGENIQPMNTTFPTPQPFPPSTPGFKAPPIATDISPDLAPEDDQDETDDGRNEIPDSGITEQPETQQPEDSSEGVETSGPLT